MALFEKLQDHFSKNLPFVIYNKPNESDLIGLFQQNDHLYTIADYNEKGFVFAPFNGNTVLIPKVNSEIISEYWKADERIVSEKKIIQNEEPKSFHEKIVKKAIQAILEDNFGKVVISRKEILECEDLDLVTVFQKILNAYPNAFTYCWFHPKVGLWMGAFSERLLKVENNVFHTMALAGTQPFEGTEEIIWKSKEKEEQQFVTDYILDNLKDKISEISSSGPYTIKAGNLLHIKTDIQGKMNLSSDLKQLVEALHPTPAVCGYPVVEARQFILENENYDREFYSGFLGELNLENKTDLFVNLRCVQIKNNQIHFYMGGGITKDSIPEKEWMETVNKSLTMKKMFLI